VLTKNSKGLRIKVKGSKVVRTSRIQAHGRKVKPEGDGGNDLKKVMFSFFFHPELFRLPIWGDFEFKNG
jgi:hypothetical protein